MKSVTNDTSLDKYFDNFLAYTFGGSSISIETDISSFDDDYEMLRNDFTHILNDFSNAKIELGFKK